jgi:hypothetical protein
MPLQLDTKTLLQAAAIVTAVGVLGGAGVAGFRAAVVYVGGDGLPYESKAEAVQVAALAAKTDRKVKQSIPYIVWQLLQNDAEGCDNRTTVLNIQAKAAKSPELHAEADKNDHRCGKLHDDADAAAKALLPR